MKTLFFKWLRKLIFPELKALKKDLEKLKQDNFLLIRYVEFLKKVCHKENVITFEEYKTQLKDLDKED